MEQIKDIDGRSFHRIALVSDTHGPINQRVANQLRQYDCVVHAGDIGCVAAISAREMPVFAVRGNNDSVEKWPLEERGALDTLPDCLNIKLVGGSLVVVHGHQFSRASTRHEKLRQQFPLAKAVVYGHSHRQIIDKSTMPWILNPGASGERRTFGGASFLSLMVSERSWRVSLVRP